MVFQALFAYIVRHIVYRQLVSLGAAKEVLVIWTPRNIGHAQGVCESTTTLEVEARCPCCGAVDKDGRVLASSGEHGTVM